MSQDRIGDCPGRPRVTRDEIVPAARRWLFDVLLPFWCDVGFDRRLGAFVEQLSTDGSVTPLGFKRVRVQARQIYAYSHAAILGFSGPALECATRAFEFLEHHAWIGARVGWGRAMGADGGLRDGTPDLYDNAFVLFGLAWLYQATSDRNVKKWIDRTGDAIEEVFADKNHGGYWHAKPPSGWREQNPLMHLLEAYLAAFQATKDDRWIARAGELVALAESRLFDRETGTLAELYAPDWSRAPPGLGDRVEPGHHFEWFWLLDWYARSRAIQVSDIAEPLFSFAEREGVDRVSGLTYDSVSSAGRPIDRSARCWPQCETIKARVVRSLRFGSQDLSLADCAVDNFLHRFVAPAPPGTWIEHLDPEGRPKGQRIPASSVYHIVLALSVYLQGNTLETRSAG